jgi:hypothetical protein
MIDQSCVLFFEKFRESIILIKKREKAKRDAGRHYLRHRETVLGKHRAAAASVASSQKDTVDDSIRFSTVNGVITFD